MVDISIKKSKIEGNGLFANKNFKKGEIILVLSSCSKVLEKRDLENLSKEEKNFVSEHKTNQFILFFPPARFVNHSCSPNSKLSKMLQIAKRDVKKGEEITTDYSKENLSKMGLKCNCGSPNCKKSI